MTDILPIFSSSYSIGRSILTVDEPIIKDYTKPLPDDRPLSIFEIAKKHSLNKVIICDDNISGFWQIHEVGQKCGIEAFFGWRCSVVDDAQNKSEESLTTEHKMIILFKNSQAYYDIIKLYTRSNTSSFYYNARMDWNDLAEFYSDNFIYAIPFYSGLIYQNRMMYNRHIVPKLGKIKPIVLLEDNKLPFDPLLRRASSKWAQEEGFDTQESLSIYYYRKEDVEALQAMRCIIERSSLEKPELNGFSSSEFSLESYMHKIGKTI